MSETSQVWLDGAQAMREAIAQRIESIATTLGVPHVVVTAEQIRETDIPFTAGSRHFLAQPLSDPTETLALIAEWRPIETVPMDGTPVLVYLSADYHKSRQHTGRFLPNMQCGVIGGLFGFDLPGEPTHWRHLPDGPREHVSRIRGQQ